jgi:hypothetical protein
MPLPPKQAIGEAWDVAHMDSRTNDAASLADRLKRPRLRAKDWVPTSPGRVKANTVRPCHLATCATIWAAAPSHRGPASCQRRRPGRGRVAGSHVGVQGVGGSESSQFPQLRRRHVGTGGGGFADETRRTSLAFANLIGGSKSMSTNTRRISAQQS